MGNFFFEFGAVRTDLTEMPRAGADDERWLRETLPDAVRKKLGAGARAEAQKGRSHKKGAGKAAQLEQQKAEDERRKREEAEKRAALAAQPATRGKKSKEEDLVQVSTRRPNDHPLHPETEARRVDTALFRTGHGSGRSHSSDGRKCAETCERADGRPLGGGH